MGNLTVWALQIPIASLNVDDNLAAIEEFLAASWPNHSAKPDLMVLPELFGTPFDEIDQSFAEPPNGKQSQWLKMMAKRYHCTFFGSVLIREKTGLLYNRGLAINEKGLISYYDKKALFPNSYEHKAFSVGDVDTAITINDFKIKFRICYELRFPELAINHFENEKDVSGEFDLLVYIAQWPKKRIAAWKHLLPARAIENRSYVLGVNRSDYPDGEAIYNGHSEMFSYNGESFQAATNEPCILAYVLSLEALHEFRRTHPFVLGKN
jgi:omega-amidase